MSKSNTVASRELAAGIRFMVFYTGMAVGLGLGAIFTDMWLFRTFDLAGPLAWALAALPGVIICGGLFLTWRSVRLLDEVRAAATREAVFLTLCWGTATMIVWGFIAHFTEAPALAAPFIFPLYAAWWGLICPITFRKAA